MSARHGWPTLTTCPVTGRTSIKPIGWQPRSKRDSAEQDVFQYPRLGPGQLWEAAAAALADLGVIPCLDSRVVKVRFDGKNWTVELQNGESASGDAIFSSMPLRLLVDALEPAPPKHVRAAAAALQHRSLITVAIGFEALRHAVQLGVHAR